MTNRKRVPGKPTMAQMAERIGCTPQTLRKYRDMAGVDITDEEAVRAFRNTLRFGDVPTAAGAPDIRAEKLRLTKAQADRAELEVRRLRGELIPLAEVREALVRIGGAVKAHLLRFENDLPPRLHGLEPGDMQIPIREAVDTVLCRLSDMTDAAYGP